MCVKTASRSSTTASSSSTRMYAPSVVKIVPLALDLQVTFDMESALVDGTLRS